MFRRKKTNAASSRTRPGVVSLEEWLLTKPQPVLPSPIPIPPFPEDIAPGLRKIEREAAKDGLVFHYDRAIAANTFNAHRLVKYAAAHGVPDMLDRLFEAHFRDGLDVGSRDVLEELARREGLSAGFLDTEQYAAEVRGDEEEAKKLGIRLVPHFIIDGKLTYKGALSQDYMTGVFRNIIQKNNLLPPEGKGITCGPDGCTLG